MKVRDLQLLHNTLQLVLRAGTLPDVQDFKFSFMLAKNARLVRGEIDDLETALNANYDMHKLRAYEDNRVRLLTKAARKNDNGQPILINNQYVFNGDAEEILAEIEAELDRKHPGVREKMRERVEQSEAMLKDDVEVKLHLYPIKSWPNLPPAIMDGLFPLVDEGALKTEVPATSNVVTELKTKRGKINAR